MTDWVYRDKHLPTFDPNAGYMVTDIDDTSDPQYFLNVATNGLWFIMEYNVGDNTFRFCKGDSDYAGAWTGRALLTYDYPDKVW